MTRITQAQQVRSSLNSIQENRRKVDRLQNDISSGTKVHFAGDDAANVGAISQLQTTLNNYTNYKLRISDAISSLTVQDDLLIQANEVMIRAKELATQGANESNGSTIRAQMSDEVFQLRDQLAGIANTKYQGRYIYGGADDDDPPFDAQTYTNPSSGKASERYVFDAEDGTTTTRSIKISDNLSVTLNTDADSVFSNSIAALERLGRALAGYRTEPVDSAGIPSGLPDGSGTAFTFPTDTAEQTQDILETIDLIDSARTGDVIPEQTNVAGRISTLENTDRLLSSLTGNLQNALSKLKDTDVAEAGSALSEAQTALQASYSITSRILQQSILDYL